MLLSPPRSSSRAEAAGVRPFSNAGPTRLGLAFGGGGTGRGAFFRCTFSVGGEGDSVPRRIFNLPRACACVCGCGGWGGGADG